MKETYKFQYEKWHQDTAESKAADVRSSIEFIETHGIWPENRGAEIIDIGCGMGRFLLAFREKGYKNLSGVDIDDYQIEIARKEKLDAQLVDANVFFSKTKKRYDLLTMVDCLEHVDKDKQITLLTNVNKSMKSDGKLVIRVPNALAPAVAYFRYIDFTHKWSYTEESLGYVLKNSGFEYIAFRPAWQEPENIAKLKAGHAKLLKAEFGIDNPILTSNMVAVAFKSKKAFDSYQKNAPTMEVNYESKKSWWNNIINR